MMVKRHLKLNILKENQLHYKVRLLGYNITHNSWVNKEDIEKNAPEVLATC